MINYLKTNKKLREELSDVQDEIDELLQQYGDPKFVVEQVLGRGIKWYDASQIESEEGRKIYHRSAKDILKNKAFNNEVNSIIADCVNYCAKKSPNHEKTLGARMTINALELLKQRIEDINLEDGEITQKSDRLDDLYNKHYN